MISDEYVIVSETSGDGKDDRGVGTLMLHVAAPSICIRLPREPVSWLNERRCADAIVLEFFNESPVLHLVELKSKMTPKEWQKTKQQLRGAYHNALAVGGVLHLQGFSAIKTHVAYREDSVSPEGATAPSTLKLGLVQRLPDNVGDWIARRLVIDGIAAISLNLILRDAAGNAAGQLQ
jgi:hypothetical protein